MNRTSSDEFNFDNNFHVIKLISYALIATPVMNILIASSGVLTAPSIEVAGDDQLFTILIGVALFLSVLAPYVRRLVLSSIKKTNDSTAQSITNRYKAGVIASLGLWDGVTIIGLLAAAIFGDVTACYSLSILAFFGMYFARPKESELSLLIREASSTLPQSSSRFS